MASHNQRWGATGPIPRLELERLIRQAQKGDAHARERVLASTIAFATSTAERFARQYRFDEQGTEDLVSEAVIGLNRAIDMFKATFGVSFLSYAGWWVKAKLRRATQQQSRLRRRELLSDDFHHEHKDEYDVPQFRTPWDLSILDVLTVQNEAHSHFENTDQVQWAMALLKPLHQQVVRARYFDGKTLEQVGDDLGYSREWVRKILLEALRRLKQHLENGR